MMHDYTIQTCHRLTLLAPTAAAPGTQPPPGGGGNSLYDKQ